MTGKIILHNAGDLQSWEQYRIAFGVFGIGNSGTANPAAKWL
jgi:hypothetical protein